MAQTQPSFSDSSSESETDLSDSELSDSEQSTQAPGSRRSSFSDASSEGAPPQQAAAQAPAQSRLDWDPEARKLKGMNVMAEMGKQF